MPYNNKVHIKWCQKKHCNAKNADILKTLANGAKKCQKFLNPQKPKSKRERETEERTMGFNF